MLMNHKHCSGGNSTLTELSATILELIYGILLLKNNQPVNGVHQQTNEKNT